MKITEKEVKKISELARLELTDDEMKYYAEELSVVLDYAEQLNKIKTKDVEPMAQSTNLFSATREDEQRGVSKNIRAHIVENIIKALPFKNKGFVKVKSVFNRTNN